MIQVFNAAPADFDAILALQERNHLSTLADDARGDGFLTTYLTSEILERLREDKGIVIAHAEGGALAGFAGAHAWDLTSGRPWPLAVRALFPLQFDGAPFEISDSFQYGPACVAGEFRGQGILRQLLGGVCENFAPRFEFGLTFIDHRNLRSLNAHERKLGFQIVAELPFDTTIYHVLSFRTRSFL